jgi:uncharacterized protein (TIGR03118 family)
VVKGDAAAPNLSGSFTDPNLPGGYAPFNIQNIGGKIYVTYAVQNGKDDLPGLGHGIVSVFDSQGNFLARVGTMGTLNSPWGMAIAPGTFGAVAGKLLVGNFGDGFINVFDQNTDTFLGQLTQRGGGLIHIEGLWGLIPGNDGSGGSSKEIYFSAGPSDESHGLFGAISLPEPGSAVLGLIAVGLLTARWQWKSWRKRASA